MLINEIKDKLDAIFKPMGGTPVILASVANFHRQLRADGMRGEVCSVIPFILKVTVIADGREFAYGPYEGIEEI